MSVAEEAVRKLVIGNKPYPPSLDVRTNKNPAGSNQHGDIKYAYQFARTELWCCMKEGTFSFGLTCLPRHLRGLWKQEAQAVFEAGLSDIEDKILAAFGTPHFFRGHEWRKRDTIAVSQVSSVISESLPRMNQRIAPFGFRAHLSENFSHHLLRSTDDHVALGKRGGAEVDFHSVDLGSGLVEIIISPVTNPELGDLGSSKTIGAHEHSNQPPLETSENSIANPADGLKRWTWRWHCCKLHRPPHDQGHHARKGPEIMAGGRSVKSSATGGSGDLVMNEVRKPRPQSADDASYEPGPSRPTHVPTFVRCTCPGPVCQGCAGAARARKFRQDEAYQLGLAQVDERYRPKDRADKSNEQGKSS